MYSLRVFMVLVVICSFGTLVSADDKGSEWVKEYLGKDEKVLITLEETVNPKHTALLVVDMQNNYVHGRDKTGPTPGKPLTANEKIVPNLVKFVDVCRKVGVPIFWVIMHSGKDVDLPTVKAFTIRRGDGPKNIEGTKGAEIISELVPQKGEPIIVKHTYSGFVGTDLDTRLKSRGIVSLIMSGNATDICLDATLKYGFHLNYYIVVGSDITSTITEGVHDIYLKSFAKQYGLVSTSNEIAKIWGVELEQRK